MPENVTLNAGTGGVTAAADEIGGVHFQRVKLIHGADGVNAGDVAAGNPLPVTNTPVRGNLTNISGPILVAATAQQIAAANSARLGWCIQNLHPANDLWVSTLATAVQSQPSIRVPAGALYESPPGGQGTGAISVIGPTAGQTYTAREW